jgi:cell division protein FtsW (lipid II flippase)
MGDRQVDIGIVVGTAAIGVVSVVLTRSPWRYVLFALLVGVVCAMALQIARRYRPTPSFIVRDRPEAAVREWLLKQHFSVTPEEYKIACNYCDWETRDYARRLTDAPRLLHDAHPSNDPRIPSLLRLRWTAWLGRLVTTA